MKTYLLLPLLLAAPAFAGTSAKQVVAPAPDPCLTSWFAGASIGYLTELEEPMYNVHLGVTNSCWTVAGFNISLFAEVGYTDTSWSDEYTLDRGDFTTINQVIGATVKESLDLTIVPITANIKFERNLTGNLNAYIGGGLGMAWIDADMDGSITPYKGPKIKYHESDSDWVFTAQVFAGLSYNAASNCEIYGGGRWIYYADPTLGGGTWDMDDDWLLELGARYKF